MNNENITLEDFSILKVIDKGSFGKVFLVSNKKMGKLYAMKRINKDVLIEKKQIKNIRNESAAEPSAGTNQPTYLPTRTSDKNTQQG